LKDLNVLAMVPGAKLSQFMAASGAPACSARPCAGPGGEGLEDLGRGSAPARRGGGSPRRWGARNSFNTLYVEC